MTKHLTPEQVGMARRLRARGMTLMQIAREVGCVHNSVRLVVSGRKRIPVDRDVWVPGPGRLTLEDREEISFGLAQCLSFTSIAGGLGVSTSTVSREVGANGGRGEYRAYRAHRRARARARRPKPGKLGRGVLLETVSQGLELWWSPQEISCRLQIDFPDDPMMRVSHETIYQSLFVQGRGELRRELHRCLRSGRARRRSDGVVRSGPLKDKVMLSDRPAEAIDRAVPGHWEGDLIIGKNNGSAVGTLVERTTRFVILLHLPNGHDSISVEDAMREAIQTLPDRLKKSITWDQGVEMARHAEFTIATGIPIYFCDPHSPWQRGTNENTNGLLRQYMPKGTNLNLNTAKDLDRFAASLNGRPRATLGYMTPSERLNELLAHTA